jgi:N-sulfoglucosamine sulfohydrolase
MKYILLFVLALHGLAMADDRPNIVWIFVEDMNGWMGCYGDDSVPTPNIDALAETGMRFERAYMPAGVCSATRSAIAMGCMQTTLGIHNHVSSARRVPEEVFSLADRYNSVYQLLRSSGYYTINDGNKKSFNFEWPTHDEKMVARIKNGQTSGYISRTEDESFFDRETRIFAPTVPPWDDCPKGKPLFVQFQLKGGKNSGQFKGSTLYDKTGSESHYDQSKVDVMPYYPDLPYIRREIAHHYDTIRQTDEEVGQLMDMLKADGLYENTIFFFFTDHGMKLYRHKQWLYEGGIRVPLIISGPGIKEGVVREDLVSGIDIPTTTLALTQTPIPDWMEGKDLLADDYKRDFVISARDRCDFTIERVRAVTTKRFKYLRNFMTDRPFMQPQYRDGMAFVEDARQYYKDGEMNAAESFCWSPTRVPEELYDLDNDPHEIHNLADDPAYAATLKTHQDILTKWIKETDDKGQYPETISALRGVLQRHGDKAVNPEFDKAR